MPLDDIWEDPVAFPPANGEHSPLKRPRQSLFLPDSDSDPDSERPPKRATPAPPPARPPPDVDALFDDLDKDEDDEDLTYKPLAPALDLGKLAKEAEERLARARQTAPSQSKILTSGGGGAGKDASGKEQGKGKSGDGEKTTGRKVLPKLDEERLVGPEGFPQLVEDIKGFQPRGKGSEHADLNRLLQVYQFWTHRMYPKMSFRDTVNRVEKLCHSKRMQVRLSVWRDEFKGVTNNGKVEDDPDIIDLTEPTLIRTEDDGNDKESQGYLSKDDPTSSRPPSLPPVSSEPEDDDFDIDAVIRAEEERLSILRVKNAGSEAQRKTPSPTPQLGKSSSVGNVPDANAMDLDDASLWDAVDDSQMLFDPPDSKLPSSVPADDDDDDMWDVVDEMEQEGRRKPARKTQIPISGVNVIPSLDSADSGNASRATNDDDWDEMYS